MPKSFFLFRKTSGAKNTARELLASIAIRQGFLSMLCLLGSGTLFLFAACVAAMTAFAGLLVPETKWVPWGRMTAPGREAVPDPDPTLCIEPSAAVELD